MLAAALARHCVALGCFAVASLALPAQEVIHALTGTVASISDSTHTMTVLEDTGKTGTFDVLVKPTHTNFDKKIESETTAANAFKQQGAYVIVFYFGSVSQPTVVALKALGHGPFAATVGRVQHFDSRSVSIEDESGKVQTFKIGTDTVAETSYGVEQGFKARVQSGDKVRIVSATVDGNPTALFLRAM
jgi:hypothetical protein